MFSGKMLFAAVMFITALAIGTHAVLRWYGPIAPTRENQAPVDTNAIRIIDDSGVDAVTEGVMLYTENGFTPAEISIAIDRGLGCVVILRNTSSRRLWLGLSPHNLPKDPGREYPPIAPAERFLFDPRFSGFTELEFHDHEHPAFRFLVKFAKSCQ